MWQKHLCTVFHLCRLRNWNASHICSSLWPEMGQSLLHLWKQCLVTAVASGRGWHPVPVSLYAPFLRSTPPPDSWHERSSSSFQHFVFICAESSEQPRSSGREGFQGWLVVSPTLPLGHEGLAGGFTASAGWSCGHVAVGLVVLDPSGGASHQCCEDGCQAVENPSATREDGGAPWGITVLKLRWKFIGMERSTFFSYKCMCGHKTWISFLFSMPHVKGLPIGHRFRLQPVAARIISESAVQVESNWAYLCLCMHQEAWNI